MIGRVCSRNVHYCPPCFVPVADSYDGVIEFEEAGARRGRETYAPPVECRDKLVTGERLEKISRQYMYSVTVLVP